MNLFIKCIVAVIVMIAIHYISKTQNYYIIGLLLNQIGHVGQSTSLIYFAITFTVQKLIVQKRASVLYSM